MKKAILILIGVLIAIALFQCEKPEEVEPIMLDDKICYAKL